MNTRILSFSMAASFLILFSSFISLRPYASEPLYYKYLYTVDAEGMKFKNKAAETTFNGTIKKFFHFSNGYNSLVIDNKELDSPWRLGYTGTRDGVMYYNKLYIPGMREGMVLDYYSSGICGGAAGNFQAFLILCGQSCPGLSFTVNRWPNFYYHSPESPMEVLIKSDWSKINIYFKKTKQTIVLERADPNEANSQSEIPRLIE